MFLPYNHRGILNEISEQEEECMIAVFSFQESSVLLGIFPIYDISWHKNIYSDYIIDTLLWGDQTYIC